MVALCYTFNSRSYVQFDQNVILFMACGSSWTGPSGLGIIVASNQTQLIDRGPHQDGCIRARLLRSLIRQVLS